MTGYKWKPIEDLPDDWQKLASSELAGLFAVWKEHVVTLKDSPAYLEFQARLRREWAIETGIIEGLYDIDRGVTRTLIERGLHASLIAHGDANKPAEEIIPMLKDHEAVVEGLFDFVGQKRELSTSYIKQVHQALTTHQETATGIDSFGQRTQIPLLQGDWKKWPNNPTRSDGSIHEYCPPEQVASEMDRLIEMHKQHLQEGVPPEVEAAWLHHRFTQIHPFQDGNGRVARALASLVLIRAGWFPFVVHRDHRTKYIDCLEKADSGDISSLIMLFSQTQKQAFLKVISLSEQVILDGDPMQGIISAAAMQLRRRKQDQASNDRFIAIELGKKLQVIAEKKMTNVASAIMKGIVGIDSQYLAFVESSSPENKSLFSGDAAAIAEKLDYPIDLDSFTAWICLTIREERKTRVVLFFHLHGNNFIEATSVSAWIDQLEVKSGGRFWLKALCQSPFVLFAPLSSELDPLQIKDFDKWLDDVLFVGLDQWRRQI